jgi:hypothetical protein
VELFDYLFEAGASATAQDDERHDIREAHLALREMDQERGSFDNWWHAGCNGNLVPGTPDDVEAPPR